MEWWLVVNGTIYSNFRPDSPPQPSYHISPSNGGVASAGQRRGKFFAPTSKTIPKNWHNAVSYLGSLLMYDSPVILADETGKTLPCEVDDAFEVEGMEYLLLQPVDAAVQILAWRDVNEEEQELTDIDDEELDLIFPIAKAVLAEQNLILKRTAFTLTVEGELPEVDEEQIVEIDSEDEDMSEELQEIAQFYYEEQAYSIFVPLDPMYFYARRNKDGKIEPVFDAEELEKLYPYIQQRLQELEDDVECEE